MEPNNLWNESFKLTLDEQVRILENCLAEAELTAILGEMWKLKKSDASFSASRALGRLSSYHRQATVVLSQLRSWMVSNGYATTLTTEQVLKTWFTGSVLLMESIEYTFQTLFWEDLFEACVPNLVAEIHELYPEY